MEMQVEDFGSQKFQVSILCENGSILEVLIVITRKFLNLVIIRKNNRLVEKSLIFSTLFIK